MRDGEAIEKLIAQVNPEEIYHLAALAFIPDSISNPRLTFDTNLYGTLNILEAARKASPRCRILFVGSADEYGRVRRDELPIAEHNPLRPANPYSVSKASASMLAYQYALSERMHIVRVRPFNHTGPRQSPQFVCSDFARQIVEAERGSRPPHVHVGNLKPRRDFTDARDVVRAYRDVLRRGDPSDVYNVCSGIAVSIGEVLEQLLALSASRPAVVESPERTRESDVNEIRGDFAKLQRTTGWRPAIPLSQTLHDLIEHWRTVN
jgi:GDP-4-dehydro-6-deoxy-D-mannose reductase